MAVAERALEKVQSLKGTLIPSGVEVTVTRNYGATAQEKSNELLQHLLLATLSVTLLIALALGWRSSMVVLAAVPVTLALTLFIYFIYGYTLNRVTLFALIFSIGILVDDAIVVVENITRHFHLPENKGRPLADVAVEAVDEVGNPTTLATWTVIAAVHGVCRWTDGWWDTNFIHRLHGDVRGATLILGEVEVPCDVLHHHDGVVHQDANGEDQCEEVERVAIDEIDEQGQRQVIGAGSEHHHR